jgi:hypothetical protein
LAIGAAVVITLVTVLLFATAVAGGSNASPESPVVIPQDIPFDRGICGQYAHQPPIC